MTQCTHEATVAHRGSSAIVSIRALSCRAAHHAQSEGPCCLSVAWGYWRLQQHTVRLATSDCQTDDTLCQRFLRLAVPNLQQRAQHRTLSSRQDSTRLVHRLLSAQMASSCCYPSGSYLLLLGPCLAQLSRALILRWGHLTLHKLMRDLCRTTLQTDDARSISAALSVQSLSSRRSTPAAYRAQTGTAEEKGSEPWLRRNCLI